MKKWILLLFFNKLNMTSNYIEAYCIRFLTPSGIKSNIHIVVREIKDLSDLRHLYDSNAANHKFLGSERKFIKIIDKEFFTNTETRNYCINNLKTLFNNHIIPYQENKIYFKEGFLFDGIFVPNISKILIIFNTIDQYKLNFDGKFILSESLKKNFYETNKPLVETSTGLLVSIILHINQINENVVKISTKINQLLSILDNLLDNVNKRELVLNRLIYIEEVVKILQRLLKEQNTWFFYFKTLNKVFHCDVLLYIFKKMYKEIEVAIVFYKNLMINGSDKGILGHFWRLAEFHKVNFNNFTRSLIVKKLFIRREVIKELLINFMFSSINHTIKKNYQSINEEKQNFDFKDSNNLEYSQDQILNKDLCELFMIV